MLCMIVLFIFSLYNYWFYNSEIFLNRLCLEWNKFSNGGIWMDSLEAYDEEDSGDEFLNEDFDDDYDDDLAEDEEENEEE